MDLSATIDVDRPATDVFAYVMNVSHDAQWRTGVVEAGFTSTGALGVGTTGYDKVDANGREAVATWTVYDYEADSHARWTLDAGPIRGTGGYICDPIGAGTRFTLEAHVKPTGWYRILGPLFGMIGRRQNRADVRKLKGILETP
jgi:hypothetical protein